MARRIALLFNYPLVDNTALKQDLIRALYGQHTMLSCSARPMGWPRFARNAKRSPFSSTPSSFAIRPSMNRLPSRVAKEEVLRNESSVQAAGLREDQSGTIFLEPGPRGSRVLTRRR